MCVCIDVLAVYVSDIDHVTLCHCHVTSVIFIAPLTDGTKYIFGLRFNGEPLYLLFIESDADLPYPHRSFVRV